MIHVGSLFISIPVLLLVESCEVFKDSNFLAVGVTPKEAEHAAGLPVMVYGYLEPVDHQESPKRSPESKILYNTDEYAVESVNAYMLVDRNSTVDLLLQANSLIGRGGFKRNNIVCVKSTCDKPPADLFLSLWYRTMYYVAVECADGVHYVFDPFGEQVVKLEEPSWPSMRSVLLKIWRNMRGTVIKVSAFPEPLSYVGSKPALGRGVDSSFLYEFSKRHNFTPELIDGRNYRFSNLQVWTHQAEFGVNSRFLENYDQKFTISRVIYGDGICHVVKVRGFVRGWEVFEALFRTEVWFCLLGAVICINTVLSWICRQRSWSDWLGSCFAFSLIFISYVQAMLFQILRSKPPIVFPPEELVYKYVSVTRDNTPFTGDSTVMRKKQYVLGVISGLVKADDYVIKCPGYTRNYAYLMNYGTPLEPHINQFVYAAFESGLPDAWFSMTVMKRKRFYDGKEKFKILTLLDFEVAFFELVIGLTVSVGVFLWEHLNSRLVYVGNDQIDADPSEVGTESD